MSACVSMSNWLQTLPVMNEYILRSAGSDIVKFFATYGVGEFKAENQKGGYWRNVYNMWVSAKSLGSR